MPDPSGPADDPDVEHRDDQQPPGALGDYAASTGTTGHDLLTAGNNTPLNGAFHVGEIGKGVRFLEITDGLSNTILIGEKHVQPNKFGVANNDCSIFDGANIACSTRAGGVNYPIATSLADTAWKFGSYHPNGCQFVFADGSVRMLPSNIDSHTLEYLISINDGNVIPDY